MFDVEEMILEMAEIVKEKRYLEEEVMRLEEEVRQYRKLLDNQFSNSRDNVANVLNLVLEKML